MICDSCNTEHSHLIHIESHGDINNSHVCVDCMRKIDMYNLKRCINRGFKITEDMMFITDKYETFQIPIRRVEHANNRFTFNLSDEPKLDYLFSTNDHNVIRLRTVYRQKVIKK